MPQIAGLRGVVPEASKLGEVILQPIELAKGLAAGTLTRDPSKAVYRYHQTFAGPGGRTFTRKMVVCAVRLAAWSEGLVRPHEATTAAGRDAALAKIRANRAHTEPVLAGFRDAATEVDRLFRTIESGRPTFEHVTADGTVHRVWRAQDSELIGKLHRYFAPKKLHLLEGHDRYEAMLAYRDELGSKQELSMYASPNYGLALLVSLDDPALMSAARHRIVRGVTAKSAEVLAAAKQHFIIEKLAGVASDVTKIRASLADTVAHQPAFVMAFAGEPDAWKLTLSPDVSPIAEGVLADRALQKLDPIVIEGLVMDRVFKGSQVTTEVDAKIALAALGAGANVVVITRPLTVEQITHVDELGHLLPAQSTAFHPPTVAGLVSLVIDPDEDLV
jgi:uncharacterized protein (DUF1015 family)